MASERQRDEHCGDCSNIAGEDQDFTGARPVCESGRLWCLCEGVGGEGSQRGDGLEFREFGGDGGDGGGGNGDYDVRGVGGSSLSGAVFNFTNSIVGAGCIGLGGAIAISGGAISIFCILFFGVLTKLSLDMLIELTVATEGSGGTYEGLGKAAFGAPGRVAVLVSKTLYSFGCLVAYLIVVKDNFGSGMRQLLYRGTGDDRGVTTWLESFLEKEDILTVMLSLVVVLPLCMLRDLAPLAKFSAISVLSMVSIVVIVVSLYFLNPGGEVQHDGGSTYEKWLEVRPGIFESLGTFIFTYVSQHTVHLAYESLSTDIKNVKTWRTVSTLSVGIAAAVSLTIGVFVYMSFWNGTQSDVFKMYPDSVYAIDIAKILLCVTMLLTFPLPFFTCREMLVLMANDCHQPRVGDSPVEEGRRQRAQNDGAKTSAHNEEGLGEDLEEPLLEVVEPPPPQRSRQTGTIHSAPPWTMPDDSRQLRLTYHIILTSLLWLIVTALAVMAPSLGDVLDLVGCAAGTAIAFVLPALFSFRLVGYSRLGATIFLVGGSVGTIGTYFSTVQLLSDKI